MTIASPEGKQGVDHRDIGREDGAETVIGRAFARPGGAFCPVMTACLWQQHPPIPVISRSELLRAFSVIGPHLAKEGWEMPDTYIIEVASQAAGIVVRDQDGYRFFAATHRFNPLEGQLFRNAREAEVAARRLMTGGVTLAA
jgi:hypothetical protein